MIKHNFSRLFSTSKIQRFPPVLLLVFGGHVHAVIDTFSQFPRCINLYADVKGIYSGMTPDHKKFKF
jgi:hypothetical protein